MALRHWLAGPALALHRLRRSVAPAPNGFRAVLFHSTRDAQAFEDTIYHIQERHGFADPVDPFQTPPSEKTPVLISFDDGFRSNATIAAAMLEAAGARGVFFVCPALHDAAPEDQRAAVAANVFRGRIGADHPDAAEPLMTWDEIAALAERGHVIGAHGMTHTRLSTLSGEALEKEVVRAADVIEARIGQRPDWYAWAFGDIDSVTPEAMAVIRGAYRFCRSGVRGWNDTATAAHAVRADMLDPAAPPAYRALTLEGGLDGRYAQARQRLDAMIAP